MSGEIRLVTRNRHPADVADCAQPPPGLAWDSSAQQLTSVQRTFYATRVTASMTATTFSFGGSTPAHRSLAVCVCALVALLASAAALQAAQERTPPDTGEEPAAAANPQVLVVFSDDSSQSWIRQLTDGFYVAGAEGGANAPAWYFEYLDAVRFQDARQADHFRTALREKYRGRRLDLIVPVSSNAIAFAVSARDELWPDVPVLFASYGGAVGIAASTVRNASSLAFEPGYVEALQTVKAVFPDATTIGVVAGMSPVERAREAEVGAAVRSAGLTFVDLAATTMAGALAEVAQLPERTILLIAGGQVDERGSAVPTWQLCEMLSGAANRPTVMLGAQFLGCGIVGGLMRDYVKVGTIIGERAMAALERGRPAREAMPFQAIATLKFDARQLQRWRVDEDQLPAGSVVQFREPSLWRDRRRELLIVLGALIVQSVTIAALLYERRGRRKAEIESRRSFALAAHVDRRSAMATLTGSIAHELSQPLSSILHNAEAAEMLVTSNRATVDELREILQDIRSEDARASQIVQRHRSMLRQHDLEKKPIDLHAVVRESLQLVAHDAAERHIQVEADLLDSPCIVVGDEILLQQVLVNLVLNAMDAMKNTPPGRRRVTVRSAVNGDTVEVSVADRGPGLTPDVSSRLFEPFMTTKPDGVGIGLAIVRSTLEAHRGTIDARNNAEGGATFRFTLPLGVLA